MENKNYSLSDFGVTKHEFQLKNGLPVLLIKKPFAPIFMEIAMRAGSVFDPDGKGGLAHFSEHLIVNGSSKISQKEFWGIPASIGASSNARTGKTFMTVELEIAEKSQLKSATEYFTHALTEIYLTDRMLEKEKGIVISEIEGRRSDPATLSMWHINYELAQGNTWGRPQLGTKESVRSITKDDVEKFFTTHCTIENMVLTVAGDCVPDDIEEAFGKIDFLKGVRNELPPEPAPLPAGARILFQQDIPQTAITVVFLDSKYYTRESSLLNFAMSYAHDGLTSMFAQKIREEKGLAYGVGNVRYPFDTFGYVGTRVGTPTMKSAEALNAIEETYAEFLYSGISQHDIENKADAWWYSSKIAYQTSRRWVHEFSIQQLYPVQRVHGPFPDGHNYRKTYREDEMNKILRQCINLSKYYLIVVGKNAYDFA